MRYGSVQNAEFHLFCSENRNFLEKRDERDERDDNEVGYHRNLPAVSVVFVVSVVSQ